MRTTINIEDSIFDEILKITKAHTKTEAVNKALQEYIRMKRKQKLLDLAGKIHIEEDWKTLREMEKVES